MKICSKCLKRKRLSSFHKRSRSRDGLQPICIVCANKRKRNPRLRKARDPRTQMLESARKRARQRGLSFGLSIGDVIIPEFCPVLGILLHSGSRRDHDSSPSIDRLAPVLGYVPQNIKVISYRANRLKSDASIQELEYVLRYMKGL